MNNAPNESFTLAGLPVRKHEWTWKLSKIVQFVHKNWNICPENKLPGPEFRLLPENWHPCPRQCSLKPLYSIGGFQWISITVRAEIFAVVLFSRISRVKPSRKFPLQFMSIYSNDNISKIAKLTTRELPHLAKTVKITVRENNGVYSNLSKSAVFSFQTSENNLKPP